MKKLNRYLLGVLSSLLFAAGFARAADRLDPMSQSLPPTDANVKIASTQDCNGPSSFVDEVL